MMLKAKKSWEEIKIFKIVLLILEIIFMETNPKETLYLLIK
jgi:hypothetical protein